jgi:hypothetical protein
LAKNGAGGQIVKTADGKEIKVNLKPKLNKVFEKANAGLGLNSKRIGRSIYSLDESGNIIKQDVTLHEPDELRVSRMTDSRYIKRSTVLGFPVSAGVTPSRVIPPGAARP